MPNTLDTSLYLYARDELAEHEYEDLDRLINPPIIAAPLSPTKAKEPTKDVGKGFGNWIRKIERAQSVP